MTVNLGGKSWRKLGARVRKQLARLNDDGTDAFLDRLHRLAGRAQPSHVVSADDLERQVQVWLRLLEGRAGDESTADDQRVTMKLQESPASSGVR